DYGDDTDEDSHGACQTRNRPLTCSKFHFTHRNLCIQYSDLYDEIDESDELSCYHNTTITCTNQTNHCDHQRCHDLLNG
ncbi:unnamed protein product, partial [Rotaria sordida]